jgi:hypothetical protein
MRSPFPGMDPYLERHWLDVHTSLVTYSRDQIQRQLGDDLVARAEERLVVEDPTGPSSRRIGPDLRVVEHGLGGQPVQPASGVAVAEPLVFHIESEAVPQHYIEILDVSTGGRVITSIEFISPSNKLPGDGLEQYQRKQRECREAEVNLVEIDLTRAGRRELLAHRWAGTRPYETTYQVSVWRAAWVSRCELYPVKLQQPLPAIRIPLRPTDQDVLLDLRAIVDEAYTAARYDRTTDYQQPCDPPLDGEEAAWADGLLKAAGKR